MLSETLEIRQLNNAACHLLGVDDPHALIGEPVMRLLDPLPFLELQRSGRALQQKRLHLAAYKKHVDQTLVLDRASRLIICIMRDVTQEEAQREAREALSRTTIEAHGRCPACRVAA